MKKFIATAVATTIITVAAVFGWNKIVVDHFGFWNYPEWMAYGLVCLCAFTGGMVGEKLDTIFCIIRNRKNFN